MSEFLFGASYYDEYMPVDRIDEDFALLKKGGFNAIRIGGSTWSTLEPSDGVFDFTHIDRMLSAAGKYGINVIVATPTCAIPSWLARKHPGILATKADGRCIYGAPGQYNLLSADYRRYCERVIRKLIGHVASHPSVIGYQLDNATKSPEDISEGAQKVFVSRLRKKYPDITAFNREFGLSYGSNAISSWDDLPDIRGTINGSLSAAYKRFLRETVAGFLTWQAGIVNECKRSDQFITHNFDFAWKGYSYGIQPLTDQRRSARCVDIAGADIYHPSAGELTGREIAFCSDVAHSLKKAPHIVLETQVQGLPQWLPYRDQLKLQAYAHVAGGARGLMYRSWHSVHNSAGSYIKGILSHDLMPNETYNELSEWIKEFDRISDHLIPSTTERRIALMADNSSLVGLDEFPIGESVDYNDILKQYYDALYEMNHECDIIYKDDALSGYDLVIIPALYSCSEAVIKKILEYINGGGNVLMTFKSCFADDELKIYHDRAPHIISKAMQAGFDMFSVPEPDTFVTIDGVRSKVTGWMELLTADDEENVWSYYDHPFRERYAALTHTEYGKGSITYIGCNIDNAGVKALIYKILRSIGIPPCYLEYPLVRRTAVNSSGKLISYIFNYSPSRISFTYDGKDGIELIGNNPITMGELMNLRPWDIIIIEEK